MIKIICLGHIKEKYLQDAIKDYEKRISKFTKIEIIELEDNDNEEKEAKDLEKFINPKDYNIALAIEGKELTSLELAKKIDETFIINNNITFIIGSSNGLNQRIIESTNYQLSFSRLTFPHQLFRVILLEQIYRAFKINNNMKYHK